MLRTAARWVVPVVTVWLTLAPLDAWAEEDPPPSPGTGVGCQFGVCGVGAFDPGTDGGSSAGPKDGSAASSVGDSELSGAGSVGSSSQGECDYRALPSQPAAGSSLWEGNDPSSGVVEYTPCLTLADGAPSGTALYRFVANVAPGAAPVAPPPPTPEELAQQAYQQLPIPLPSMHFGPDDTRIAVRYWLYLWLDDPGAVTATATAGAVSVTATARLSSVTWTMGAPVSADRLETPSAPITCQGPGVKPGPGVDTTVDPSFGACAYMFQVRSTPERTGGSSTWPVTATANWTIAWAANTGESGTLAAPPKVAMTHVRVGAWSTVFVADDASSPGG
jgi:hypothetical protein